MARARSWMSQHRLLSSLIVLVALSAFSAALIGIAGATDQPSFCAGACHEMQPYTASWAQGAHANVSCVACHVDAGTKARVTHKLVASKEVWSHLTSEPAFPLAQTPEVPDQRCIACHKTITPKDPNFDHAAHAKRGRCQTCHATAGHKVTAEQLKQAGIYREAAASAASTGSAVAVIDGGSSNIAGHKPVSCTRCHNMAATGCPSCHKPKHENAGSAKKTEACTVCHSPGESFTFTHPKDRKDCTACHQAPAAKHDFKGTCDSCHVTGKSFDFKHPAQGSCESCHARPAKHRAGTCESCHKNRGQNWGFSHPGRSASCTSCHQRPSNHRAGACVSCHNPGSSWRFTHTTSLACTSCHNAPRNHFGTTCRSCHTPGRSWSRASFRHPRIPGGEHSYRSFRCAACHPNGYSSHRCSTCHD